MNWIETATNVALFVALISFAFSWLMIKED